MQGDQLTKRNIKVLERLHDIPQLGPITISPPALMIPEPPVRLGSRKSNSGQLILLRNFGLRWSIEKEQVNAAS
jgi:hypothetical protein